MPSHYEILIHSIGIYEKTCNNFNEWSKINDCLEAMKLGKKAYDEMKELKKYSKTYDDILHLIDKTRNDIKVIENVVIFRDEFNNKYNLMWRNLNVYIQALRIAKKACDEYYIFNCC
jgi:hypothetical protein